MSQRVIFHIDFDYFYAQCEELRNPKLRTKPVVVCVFSDRGGDSGAVATANYIARKYGIKSGMPIKFAKNRLEDVPDSAFLPSDFDYYSQISEQAMNVIKTYADIFEYVGRDEAYLDVTMKTNGSFSTAAHLAQQLKNSLYNSIKLSSSVGVSANKLVAKIATDFKKPDGLTIVEPENIEAFLEPLPIKVIPGIGSKTEKKFREMGLETIHELRRLDIFSLNSMFGRKIGSYIFNSARGIGEDQVSPRADPVQYSRMITLKQDTKDFQLLLEDIEILCDEIHAAIIRDGLLFKSVGIQFIQEDLSSKTKSRTLKIPTSSKDELKNVVTKMLVELLDGQKILVRRLGVRVSDLSQVSGQVDITKFF